MRVVPNLLLLAVLLGWGVALAVGPDLRLSFPVFVLVCLMAIASGIYQAIRSRKSTVE